MVYWAAQHDHADELGPTFSYQPYRSVARASSSRRQSKMSQLFIPVLSARGPLAMLPWSQRNTASCKGRPGAASERPYRRQTAKWMDAVCKARMHGHRAGRGRQVTQRFMVEVASGPRVRGMSTAPRQPAGIFGVREGLQSVRGQTQFREHWWLGNFANLGDEARSDAAIRQRAIGVARDKWRQQRRQWEQAIGPAEFQIGGHQCIIDEQRGPISCGGKDAADIDARTGGELNSAASIWRDIEQLRESAMLEELMRAELAEANHSVGAARDAPGDFQGIRSRRGMHPATRASGKDKPRCRLEMRQARGPLGRDAHGRAGEREDEDENAADRGRARGANTRCLAAIPRLSQDELQRSGKRQPGARIEY